MSDPGDPVCSQRLARSAPTIMMAVHFFPLLFPYIPMPTIIEHDVRQDSGASSALTAIVAIVAILIVVGVALYVLRVYPFARPLADATSAPSVNVNVNGSLSSSNPSGR